MIGWVDDIMCRHFGGMMLLESDYLCRSRRRWVSVVGSVCQVCRRVWLRLPTPPSVVLLIFFISFGSMGPPHAVLLILSQFARFSPGFKIRKEAEISQDTGIGCNLLGTDLEPIHTLFCRGIIDAYSKYGSALR